jgi:hypothetical protein
LRTFVLIKGNKGTSVNDVVGVWEREFISDRVSPWILDVKMGLTGHEVVDDSIELNKGTTIERVVEHKVGFTRVNGCGGLFVVVIVGLAK